ncbi:dTDP-4-dehydrorhamnose 3,5-epimerase family protein [Rhodococcoides kroppenstedtii]|uniref:dTDP-4-dehydrorhamnose 3,5-epimerase family protein n=1 Tax=Rhodococcoides kroppenstedtii TaxID=293050 RepID=UPI0028EAE503|nr:dTDP-4-dehydrorhamnose 3,5-epimerase family protein [Rhodococcus kroppenstedtii]
MRVVTTPLPDVLVFLPTPHRDDRGFFTRTFDTAIFDAAVAEHTRLSVRAADFRQDSQSRSAGGVLRGLHGRRGRGETKLVRCAHGAVQDVVVDARPDSPARGRSHTVVLDDVEFAHLLVPPGFLHGFLTLSDTADVCYRIDRPHDPTEDVGVRWDDPELAIGWRAAPESLSARDTAAGSWADLLAR